MKSLPATGRGDLPASLVLIFPLWLAYAIGILFSNSVNGVDFVSRHVWDACGGDRLRYLAVHAAIAAGFFYWLRRSRRDRTLTVHIAAPVLLEAGIYAVTLATAIQVVMNHVLGPIGVLSIPASLGPTGDRLVASLGAGVHEELVFRLGLCGGGTWLLQRAGVAPRIAIVVAILASSILFSLAHHLGPHGEPWMREVFTFRLLAGVAFALIFYYRSLAHAVYAHALYDIWVLVVVASHSSP
jgi:membrane protease YdiL (CAAX protease family)